MPLHIVNRDIFVSGCDILVNPTDSGYSGSGGLDEQVHDHAGAALRDACDALPPLNYGDVQFTPGFRTDFSYIIHTFGPIWEGGEYDEAIILRSCYLNSLMLAARLGAESVAFPLISSGTFGFPKDKVLKIATDAISDFLYSDRFDMEVMLCIYDPDEYEVDGQDEIDRFISEKSESVIKNSVSHILNISADLTGFLHSDKILKNEIRVQPAECSDLESWLKNHDDSFAVTLLKMIDEKEMDQITVYKTANLSRQTFSKIMNEKDYRPSKQTVLALAIALQLTLPETEQLLKTVGFSLSHSSKADLIIEYFITNEVYDINTINSALYKYDQQCLGC